MTKRCEPLQLDRPQIRLLKGTAKLEMLYTGTFEGLDLTTLDGQLAIYYTLDNTEPTSASMECVC